MFGDMQIQVSVTFQAINDSMVSQLLERRVLRLEPSVTANCKTCRIPDKKVITSKTLYFVNAIILEHFRVHSFH